MNYDEIKKLRNNFNKIIDGVLENKIIQRKNFSVWNDLDRSQCDYDLNNHSIIELGDDTKFRVKPETIFVSIDVYMHIESKAIVSFESSANDVRSNFVRNSKDYKLAFTHTQYVNET
jgi:hypothetical protein